MSSPEPLTLEDYFQLPHVAPSAVIRYGDEHKDQFGEMYLPDRDGFTVADDERRGVCTFLGQSLKCCQRNCPLLPSPTWAAEWAHLSAAPQTMAMRAALCCRH